MKTNLVLTQYPELDINQVYTWEERPKQYNRKPTGTIIDNVDILLADMLHDPIKMLTITDYTDPTPEHKVKGV